MLLLSESKVLVSLENQYSQSQQKISIFGDSAYPITNNIASYVSYELATKEQKEHNKRMKSVPATIEHNYALTKNLFKYLSRIDKLNILHNSRVLKLYTICTFLKNCHIMLYCCKRTSYFNLLIDTRTLLEEYTRYETSLINNDNVQVPDINPTPAINASIIEPTIVTIESNENTTIDNRQNLHRACKTSIANVIPISREYIPTNKLSLPNIQLGLAQSEIPNAGLGV